MTFSVLLTPGDGIGPEVIGETERVMSWFEKNRNIAFAKESAPIGGIAFETLGTPEPDATVAAFVKDVLANSWRANRAIKKLVDDTDGMPLKAGLAHEVHRSEGMGPETRDRLAKMRK